MNKEGKQRARELLAAEYQKHGHGRESAEARASYIERHECAAFDALARALSQQPEANGWDLERYGFPTQHEPRPVPVADGYWTPWHVAQERIASALSQRPEARGVVELSDHVIHAYDGLVRDADTLRATGNPAMAMRVASAAQVLRVAALSQPPEARGVVDEAVELLRAFQSQFGARRPDDDEDDAETWDRIDAAIAALTGERTMDKPIPEAARLAQKLASELAAAVAADEQGDGCDIAGGLFGPATTAWLMTLTAAQQQGQGGGKVCAEDLRWCEDIAESLQEAGGPTNNMRLVALNRLIRHARTAPPSAPVGTEGFRTAVEKARRVWMDENPCEDGHDHVTPFDQFLYGALAQQPAAVREDVRGLVDGLHWIAQSDWHTIAMEMPLGDDAYAKGYQDAIAAVTRRLNVPVSLAAEGVEWNVVGREEVLPPIHAIGRAFLESISGREVGYSERRLLNRAATLAQQPAAVDEKYAELLYAVSTKYPDESRHETALRYIKQAESADHGPEQAATQHQEPTT